VTGTCSACGKSCVGSHRCGENIEEAEANARAYLAEQSEQAANATCEILAHERREFRDYCDELEIENSALKAENERLRAAVGK